MRWQRERATLDLEPPLEGEAAAELEARLLQPKAAVVQQRLPVVRPEPPQSRQALHSRDLASPPSAASECNRDNRCTTEELLFRTLGRSK